MTTRQFCPVFLFPFLADDMDKQKYTVCYYSEDLYDFLTNSFPPIKNSIMCNLTELRIKALVHVRWGIFGGKKECLKCPLLFLMMFTFLCWLERPNYTKCFFRQWFIPEKQETRKEKCANHLSKTSTVSFNRVMVLLYIEDVSDTCWF